MADQEEFLNIEGAHYAACNPRYNPKWTINLKDYNYVKEDGSAIGRTDYLKSDTNLDAINALGVSFKSTYWGRTADWNSDSSRNAFYLENNNYYINAFGAKPNSSTESHGPQFVPKNYGLIPIPSDSGGLFPFKVEIIFTDTKYFFYDKKTDACYWGDDQYNVNNPLNDGPVIFFLACGGGGSGGNSATTIGIFGREGSGGGGGGAASCFGFLDLRYLNAKVRVDCGAGGKVPSTSRTGGEDGKDGGATTISMWVENKSFSYWQPLVTCYGGKGGKGVGWIGDGEGGAGGEECYLTSSTRKGFGLIGNYKGKSGGGGGSNEGGSMSTSEKIKLDILQDSALPVLNNGTYGTGTSPYSLPDSSHDGGGGGASLLSRHFEYTPLGYGTGGHGGCYKDNHYWDPACDGTSGAFIVLAVD